MSGPTSSSERIPQRVLEWLDQAEAAIDEGDLDEAERLLASVRAKRADLPELAVLEADVAMARGDVDLAIARYRRASELDPSWAAPRLEAAWAELDRDDPDAAIELARPLADDAGAEPEARATAMLVVSVAHASDEHVDEAKEWLARAEALGVADREVRFELAGAWGDLGEFAREEKILRALLAETPDDADVLHALGACLHERGEREEATRLWLRVRALDAAADEADEDALELSEDEIERLAEAALREMPESMRARLADVPIVVEDAPSEELVREGVDPRLLGLFTGTPMPEKSSFDASPSAPDAAFLYLRNLAAVCRDRDELADQVRITILHETAHFFGLEDEDLEEIGLG